MRKTKFKLFALLLIFSASISFFACSDSDEPEINNGEDTNEAHFVKHDYIELDKIANISRFRSGEGHDYPDTYEKCSSMKHYYRPKNDVDASAIKIFSPVDGEIFITFDEEVGGTQVYIKSDLKPDHYFAIFHINLKDGIEKGVKVKAGEQIGTHIGDQTWSDIAVMTGNPPEDFHLISYFDVISDDLFANYKARGVESRESLIITKEQRAADPLNCNEEDKEDEKFGNPGTIENWVYMN